MDMSALNHLSDDALIDLLKCSRGLPCEAEIEAVLDARIAELKAKRDRMLAHELAKGQDMARIIVSRQGEAKAFWQYLDIQIEHGPEWQRRILRHALQALLDAYHPPALATLGRLHLKGVEPYAKDIEKAFKLFERGARAGDGMAIYWLGYCLERGIACEPDVLRALDWYETGRNSGDIEITVARARLYLRGIGLTSQREHLAALHRHILAFHEHNFPNGKIEDGGIIRDSTTECVCGYVREFGHLWL